MLHFIMSHYQKIVIVGAVGVITIVSAVLVMIMGLTPVHTTSVSQVSLEPAVTEAAINPYQAPLEQLVTEFGDQYSTTTGLYVIDITNGAEASYNGSRQFVSASLYKLFVAYLALDAVDTNTLALDDTVPRTGATVAYCLNIMITISDDTCAVALGNVLGWQTIDARLQQEGYTATALDNYSAGSPDNKLTTPEDVATLLKRLYDGTLLSPASTQRFMSLLQAQTLEYALPTGLDSDIAFAHKTGLLDSVMHDAGFVTYQDRTLLVVMMTDGWTYAYTQAPSRFTEFGKALSLYTKATYVP